jgi:hypothetical protein
LDVTSRERHVPRVVADKLQEKQAKVARAAKTASKRVQAKSATGTISEEWLLDSDGRRVGVLAFDANSPSFAKDLTVLFEKNVEGRGAKIRRDLAFIPVKT